MHAVSLQSVLAESPAVLVPRAPRPLGAPRILITDGDERTALAATRSLIASGHTVFVVGKVPRTLAGVSRGAIRVVITADPLLDPAGYAEGIVRCAVQNRVNVLLPISDASLEALLERRDSLPAGLMLPFPALSSYCAASDKIRMIDCARDAGLAVPESALFTSPDDAERPVAPSMFPAVVKPHRSVVTTADGRRRKCYVEFVANANELRAALLALPPQAFPVLVQRRIRGPGEGMFALRWDGKIIATFAHRRIREKPPAGGVSVYRESIALDPALEAAGVGMLEALDWQGVAMIECKLDLDTGRHVLMEVNGRLWGSLQLAIDAGVDFPSLLVACAAGDEMLPQADYRIGVCSRWFWGDVDHLYARLTTRAAALHLEGEFPSRLAAIRDFLAVRPGTDRGEIWRLRDAAPALLELRRRVFGGR
jgi:predicted ATP-grasp superfamily ATP-dependent carboligase